MIRPDPADLPYNGLERALTIGVALIAVGFALDIAVGYYRDAATLWGNVQHDRNGHYKLGLSIALALRNMDLLAFLKEIESATVWPPVHGLVLSLVLLVGGPDHRLAVLPSLFGWIATVVGSWMIARRLFADRLRRLTAGAVAVTFIVASPAFRLLCSDVMLEGLGAGLSCFAILAYMRAVAAPDTRVRWRVLALELTVLFFEKSNYWLLVAASLAVAFLWEHPEASLAKARLLLAGIDVGRVARRLARDPLFVTFLVLLAIVIAIYVRGPSTVDLLGRRFSIYPPANPMTAAYAFLFLSVARSWRRHRAQLEARLGPGASAVLHWHLAPIAVSFLLPQRLADFLWYVGPGNVPGAPLYDPWAAAGYQWAGFAGAFHVAGWAANLAAGLALIGMTQLPRLAPGSRAIVALTLISAAAVVLHPNQQWRFQATWLFGVWVSAGVGASVLVKLLTPRLRAPLATSAVALLATGQALAPVPAIAQLVSIRPTVQASDLDLSTAYLPFLDGSLDVGFVASFARTPFFIWTTREHCRCLARVYQPWLDGTVSREDARRVVYDWLATTPSRVVVVIDAGTRDEPPFMVHSPDRMAGVMDAMASQVRFAREASIRLPSFPAEITIWRASPAGDARHVGQS